MDFNAKNFRYVTEQFGNLMSRCEAGERLYLRALSMEKPKDAPANLDNDFPGLAGDFRLPESLKFVSDNIFSSVLRISGKVNIWLHYDVITFISLWKCHLLTGVAR